MKFNNHNLFHYKLKKHLDIFYKIAYESNKWKKWVENLKSSIEFKALLCGHYIYSDENFVESKNHVKFLLKKKGIDLNIFLQKKIENSILNYLKQLNNIN